MIDRTAVLETIHARLTDPACGSTAHIDDPTWVSVLTSMKPDPEATRSGDRWVESRRERLDDRRTVFAVISRAENGGLSVTAHDDPWVMLAERRRITREILGRPLGVHIDRMNALALLHGTVVNEHHEDFHVSDLYLDICSGRILIGLVTLDEDGVPIPGTECDEA